MPGGGNLIRSPRYRKSPRAPKSSHARYYYTRSLVLEPPCRKIKTPARCQSAPRVMDNHSRSASPRDQPRPQHRPPSPPNPDLPTPPPSAFDNPAYQHDEDPNHNHNQSFTSQNGHGKEHNGTEKPPEAVNLELINLTPKNGAKKKDVEVDMNSANPYDEYFVPVNEHRKYMRGEKLYVTQDKRGEKGGCKRPLCWVLLALVVAAVIALIVLAATGVLFSNEPTTTDQYNNSLSSARALGGLLAEDHSAHDHSAHDHSAHDHSDHDHSAHDHTMSDQGVSDHTEHASFDDNTGVFGLVGAANSEENSEMYVPRTVEGKLKIDNEEFKDAYLDPESEAFTQFNKNFGDALKRVLFDRNILENKDQEIMVEVIKIRPGSLIVTYRIHWQQKSSTEVIDDLITPESLKSGLDSYLQRNSRMLNVYHVAEDMISTTQVLDLCQINKHDCEHGCAFDEQTLDFTCTCPRGQIVDINNNKKCMSILDTPQHPEIKPVDDAKQKVFRVLELNSQASTTKPIREEERPEDTFDWKNVQNLVPDTTTTEKDMELKYFHFYGNPVDTTPKPEPTAEPDLSVEPRTTPEPTAEPRPEPSPSAEPQPKSVFSVEMHPTPEPTAEPQQESESSGELRHASESAAEHQPDSESSAEVQPEPEPQPEPEFNPESEPRPEPDTFADQPQHTPSAEPEPTAEPKAEPEPETKTEPKEEPQPEPTAEHKLVPAPEPTAEPKVIENSETTTEKVSIVKYEQPEEIRPDIFSIFEHTDKGNTNQTAHDSESIPTNKQIESQNETTAVDNIGITKVHVVSSVNEQRSFSNNDFVPSTTTINTTTSNKQPASEDDISFELITNHSRVMEPNPTSVPIVEITTKVNEYETDSVLPISLVHLQAEQKKTDDVLPETTETHTNNDTSEKDLTTEPVKKQENNTENKTMEGAERSFDAIINEATSLNVNQTMQKEAVQPEVEHTTILESKTQSSNNQNDVQQTLKDVLEMTSTTVAPTTTETLDAMDITFDAINMLYNRSSKSIANETVVSENNSTAEKTEEFESQQPTVAQSTESDWLAESITEVGYQDLFEQNKNEKTTETNKIDDIMARGFGKDDFEPDYLNYSPTKAPEQDMPMYGMIIHDYDNEDSRVKRVNKPSITSNGEKSSEIQDMELPATTENVQKMDNPKIVKNPEKVQNTDEAVNFENAGSSEEAEDFLKAEKAENVQNSQKTGEDFEKEKILEKQKSKTQNSEQEGTTVRTNENATVETVTEKSFEQTSGLLNANSSSENIDKTESQENTGIIGLEHSSDPNESTSEKVPSTGTQSPDNVSDESNNEEQSANNNTAEVTEPPNMDLSSTTVSQYIYKVAEKSVMELQNEPAPVWETEDSDTNQPIKKQDASVGNGTADTTRIEETITKLNTSTTAIPEDQSEKTTSQTPVELISNLNVTIYEVPRNLSIITANTTTHSTEYDDHETEMNPFLPETENNKSLVKKLQEGHDLELANVNETQIDGTDEHNMQPSTNPATSASASEVNQTNAPKELTPTFTSNDDESTYNDLIDVYNSAEEGGNNVREENTKDATENNNGKQKLGDNGTVPISSFLVDTEDLSSSKEHTTERETTMATIGNNMLEIVTNDSNKMPETTLAPKVSTDDDSEYLSVVPITEEGKEALVKNYKSGTIQDFNDISDSPNKKSDKRTLDASKLHSVTNNEA